MPDTIPRAAVAAALRELRYDLNTEGNPEFSDYREGINYAIERLDATITALGLESDAFDALITSRPDVLEKLADEALEEAK